MTLASNSPKPYRQNASVIARQNQKLLLVRKPRLHHAWQFPQGGQEKNETLFLTALREFQEELGSKKIKLNPKEKGLFQYDWPKETKISPALKQFRGQTIHFFLGEFCGKNSDLKLDPQELVEFRWVKKDELKTLLESPAYLTCIQKILDRNQPF